jgi:hypothetical protein
MMDPEKKGKWVAALRSGEYEQGTGSLNNGGKFCCLGVLCDLAIEAGVQMDVGSYNGLVTYNGQQGVLPQVVMDWAGLPGPDPDVNLDPDDTLVMEELLVEGECALSAINDSGCDFAFIADRIERDL